MRRTGLGRWALRIRGTTGTARRGSRSRQGVCLVKKLKQLSNEQMQKAEVAVFQQRFDDAEQLYCGSLDRRDLAIQLRVRAALVAGVYPF